MRAAVLAAGSKVLEKLLEGIGSGRQEVPVVCTCGKFMESRGRKSKQMLTMLGPVTFERSMFQCPDCGATRFPGDEALDVVGTTRSPGLRRMMARAGSKSSFKEGQDDLKIYAGIEVNAKGIERVAEGTGEAMEEWARQERAIILQDENVGKVGENIPTMYICMDGTGIPMTKREVEGRKGKQADGSSKTREAKLGCVFTQTATDDQGRPVRDPESTTFVGATQKAEEFGWRIYTEALRRGLRRAINVVVLGDGADWIRNIVEMHFPNAKQIIDLYHAREYVSDLIKIFFGSDEKKITEHRIFWWTQLDNGHIEKIVEMARQLLPIDPESRKNAERKIAYLEKNKERMRYADFRAQGLFVGSGVMEAGCKTVIGQRLKQSGMKWSLRGANAIISLRCIFKSGRLEDYWESRSA